jgi:hypothetical protein
MMAMPMTSNTPPPATPPTTAPNGNAGEDVTTGIDENDVVDECDAVTPVLSSSAAEVISAVVDVDRSRPLDTIVSTLDDSASVPVCTAVALSDVCPRAAGVDVAFAPATEFAGVGAFETQRAGNSPLQLQIVEAAKQTLLGCAPKIVTKQREQMCIYRETIVVESARVKPRQYRR